MPPSTPNTNWMNSGACHRATVHEMLQHVQMADVITFKFKPRAALRAHLVQHKGNIAGRVLEHQIVRALQKRQLPLVFPIGDPRRHRIQREIHRCPCSGCTSRARNCMGAASRCARRHHRRPTGGHVDDAAASRLDLRQKPRPMHRIDSTGGHFPGRARAGAKSPRPLRRLQSPRLQFVSPVIGRWSDMDGVWIEPVIAQEMMIFDMVASQQGHPATKPQPLPRRGRGGHFRRDLLLS